jgi:hypothetical protein
MRTLTGKSLRSDIDQLERSPSLAGGASID